MFVGVTLRYILMKPSLVQPFLRNNDFLSLNGFMIAELLVAQNLPETLAQRAVQSFLLNFRLCPANPEMGLDEWRHLLWSQALGNEYSYLASEVYQKWLRLRWQSLALSTELANLLIRLRRRFLLGLITNGPSNAQWEKIRELDLAQYFDIILVSGDYPWEKPDGRIFLEACTSLGVRPNDCLMVGDKLDTDILGGRQAGLAATVWIPLSTEKICNFADGNLCRPDFTIKCVLELPSLLSKETEPPSILKPRAGPATNRNLVRVSHADFDDTNSNASDGS